MKYQITPVTPYQQNCTILWCEQTQLAAIVDPGGDTQHLMDTIQHLKVTLQYVLLTHGHFDHVGSAKAIADHYGVPILGSESQDQFLLEQLPAQTQMVGFPHSDAFLPDRWLHDGDVVTFGNQSLEVYHCPGHTPGHVIYFHQRDRLALVGDVLFNGSIGRTDFPRGDYNTLIKSIRDKVLPLGDDVKFISGHGPMSTLGHERIANPFLI